MAQTIKTIIRSYEIPESNRIIGPHVPNEFKDDMVKIAGKAAGICYMPDDYLSNGIQNSSAAFKRAENTANSGHYSTYEHGHVTFIIETNKMMAMILNNMRLYYASEKSARHTVMKPETVLEQEMYDKWTTKFEKIISGLYSDIKSKKDIHELAMENARYMISVFTPTVLEYTVPFNRAVLMVGWLKDMATEFINKSELVETESKDFYQRLYSDCNELSCLVAQEIGVTYNDPILTDHKNVRPEFLIDDYEEISTSHEYFGDIYTALYKGSFAMLAQAHRHRTLQYTAYIPNINHREVYIPEIIRNTPHEIEWENDAKKLIKKGIMIQGILLYIKEQGSFKDFVLKCKERLCSRAQLEICRNTEMTLNKFIFTSKLMSKSNKELLNSIIDTKSEIIPRCGFKGYTCKEPCSLGKNGLNRNI